MSGIFTARNAWHIVIVVHPSFVHSVARGLSTPRSHSPNTNTSTSIEAPTSPLAKLLLLTSTYAIPSISATSRIVSGVGSTINRGHLGGGGGDAGVVFSVVFAAGLGGCAGVMVGVAVAGLGGLAGVTVPGTKNQKDAETQ